MPGIAKHIEGLVGTPRAAHRVQGAARRLRAGRPRGGPPVGGDVDEGRRAVIEADAADIENSGAMYVAMRQVLGRHNARPSRSTAWAASTAGTSRLTPASASPSSTTTGWWAPARPTSRPPSPCSSSASSSGGRASSPTRHGHTRRTRSSTPTESADQGLRPAGRLEPLPHPQPFGGPARRRGPLAPARSATSRARCSSTRPASRWSSHQGKTVENIDQDMACRTKLAAEVKGDI